MTDPLDTLKMFYKGEKVYLVPGIEEDIITNSKPEKKMPVHVIPDEGESVRPNFFLISHQSLRTSRKTQTQISQRTITY